MKRDQVFEFFRRLAEDNPSPTTELEYRNPYTLLVAVVLVVPGAMDAGHGSALFWGSLAFSLVVAFLLTTPVNRWMISRGKGHAVVHAYHH